MTTQVHASSRVQLRDMFVNKVVEAGTKVPEIAVTDITTDSSRVTAGALFIACRGGRHHGLEFADDAIAAGAAAIAWEPEEQLQLPDSLSKIANFAITDLGSQVGDLADHFFASPSAQVTVTGITGTNGKTTTAWLASQSLTRLGGAAGYMGTLGYGAGTDLQPSALTTPGVIAVHRRLRELADQGVAAVVMEVSSHGLDQGRVDAVQISTAAFTNLTRDHLDYHGTMDAYRAAKSRLFTGKYLQNAVINVGDEFGAELAANVAAKLHVVRVALADKSDVAERADLYAEILAADSSGLQLRLYGAYGEVQLRSPLWGRFNAENLLVAAGILLVHGYDLQQAASALESCTAPAGRMQVMRAAGAAPLVVVDFAHTPDALAQALGVMREHCSGSVTVVFGCGGERDQGKRGEMGQVAKRLANRIIVTDDNPRFDDPQKIIDEILAGVAGEPSGSAEVEVVRNRAAAIGSAIRAAGRADAVLVAGKGSENWQLIAGKAQPFSDAAVAADILGSLTCP